MERRGGAIVDIEHGSIEVGGMPLEIYLGDSGQGMVEVIGFTDSKSDDSYQCIITYEIMLEGIRMTGTANVVFTLQDNTLLGAITFDIEGMKQPTQYIMLVRA